MQCLKLPVEVRMDGVGFEEVAGSLGFADIRCPSDAR